MTTFSLAVLWSTLITLACTLRLSDHARMSSRLDLFRTGFCYFQGFTMTDVMVVTVNHEKTKHKIQVAVDATVADLQTAIQHQTAVPISCQKLVHKSKSLQDPSATLASCKIKNKSKLMLIGKKEDDANDESIKAIDTVWQSCENFDKRFNELTEELKGIEQGHLDTDLMPAALKKLRVGSMSACEGLLRLLEDLDALSIPRDHERTRAKRKQTVQHIEKLLSKGDAITARVEGMQAA